VLAAMVVAAAGSELAHNPVCLNLSSSGRAFPYFVGDACSREPVLVIALVATAVVLSAPVATAVVSARAYARAQRGVAALASSSVFPRPPTPAGESHASSGLDRR